MSSLSLRRCVLLSIRHCGGVMLWLLSLLMWLSFRRQFTAVKGVVVLPEYAVTLVELCV